MVKPPPISRSLPSPPDKHVRAAGAAGQHVVLAVAGERVVAAGAADILDAAQRVGLAIVGHDDVRRRVVQGDVHAGGVGEDHGVAAGAAVEDIVGGVADEDVVAGAARGVLDQRAGVVVVEQRHGDVAGRQRGQVLIGQVVGELGLVEGRELARAQVDGDPVGVVAGVDRVVAAAVPDGEQDLVARRRALADAVDEHLAGRLAEGVDAVAGIGVEVGAVHILQRGQIVLHVRLGLVDLVAGEAAVGERRGRIGHQRPGLPVAIRGQGLAAEARGRPEEEGQVAVRVILVPVLQPHGVADLVHHGGEAPRALEGEIVIRLVGAAEPDVARDAAACRTGSCRRRTERPGRRSARCGCWRERCPFR